MYKGSNCDRKSQLSEILTEHLNPRERPFICSFFTFHALQTYSYKFQALDFLYFIPHLNGNTIH